MKSMKIMKLDEARIYTRKEYDGNAIGFLEQDDIKLLYLVKIIKVGSCP